MSSMELLRGFFALLFGGIVAFGIYDRYDTQLPDDDFSRVDRHFAPFISPWLLPLFLVIGLAAVLINGFNGGLSHFGAMCIGIFIHMSIYFALLIAVSPLLRRFISARTCAVLWLLPNMLYTCEMNFMRRDVPRHIIRIRGNWIRYAAAIWLAGAAAVLIWKFAEHAVFRKRILASTFPERNSDINNVWSEMQKEVKLKRANIPLMRSKAVSSPVSVGLFVPSTFVVLPHRDYSPEELELILRHELIHIIRRDAQTKFFLIFCAAVCWFNPLMWIAIRRCAEDLELSCDELVREGEDDAAKRRYADLILSCAGETRGFTSSLAPQAESLRYRLKQIMSPTKRLSGALIAGLALSLMLITAGGLAIAHDEDTAENLAFGGKVPVFSSDKVIDYGTRTDGGGMKLAAYFCTDPAALMNYISGLEVSRLSGNFRMEEAGPFLEIFLPGENGPRIFALENNIISIVDLGSKNLIKEVWLLEQAPDWDYVCSLLVKKNNAKMP